jgi:limonene 1,2-monooxygenase
MLGIDPLLQRERLAEGLDVILRLLRTEDPITAESEWFTMKDAVLHLRPYSDPHFEVAVAAVASPTGWSLGGKHDIGVLGVAATSEKGFEALETSWGITEQQAREHGHVADRRNLRLVGIIHIAETKKQAIEDVRFGLDHYVEYFQKTAAFPQLGFAGDTFEERVEYINDSGFGSIGTVDDAIDQISRLEEQSCGFGCFLIIAHEWANLEATRRSYELFARYVMPRFQGSHRSTLASEQRARDQREGLFERHQQALERASNPPAPRHGRT